MLDWSIVQHKEFYVLFTELCARKLPVDYLRRLFAIIFSNRRSICLVHCGKVEYHAAVCLVPVNGL